MAAACQTWGTVSLQSTLRAISSSSRSQCFSQRLASRSSPTLRLHLNRYWSSSASAMRHPLGEPLHSMHRASCMNPAKVRGRRSLVTRTAAFLHAVCHHCAFALYRRALL